MKRLGILLAIFLLCVGSVLATTITIDSPAANAVIAGPGTLAGYNITASLALNTITLGQEVWNVTFHMTGRDGVKHFIGYGVNLTENQTVWWMNNSEAAKPSGEHTFNVSRFRDQTVTITADAWNNNSAKVSTDTSTGVVLNSTNASATYDSSFPLAGDLITDETTFSITSGVGKNLGYTGTGREELKSATLVIGQKSFVMVAGDTNKTEWSYTLVKGDIPDGVYETNVLIADTDNKYTIYLGGKKNIEFDITAPTKIFPYVDDFGFDIDTGFERDEDTIIPTNILLIIGAIVLLYLLFKRK